MVDTRAILLIAIMAAVTALIRFAPFILFKGKQTPDYINYLGKYLPYSVMAMLVIYCVKGVSLLKNPYGLPEIIAIIITTILHIGKRNTLLSIVVGTICYMLLKQLVFA